MQRATYSEGLWVVEGFDQYGQAFSMRRYSEGDARAARDRVIQAHRIDGKMRTARMRQIAWVFSGAPDWLYYSPANSVSTVQYCSPR